MHSVATKKYKAAENSKQNFKEIHDGSDRTKIALYSFYYRF